MIILLIIYSSKLYEKKTRQLKKKLENLGLSDTG